MKLYEVNSAGSGFFNSIVTEDTIILQGSVLDEQTGLWGIYFAKADTLGHICSETEYYDENEDYLLMEDGYQMIKTEDGGYAIVGIAFFRANPFLIKLDINGNVEWYTEFEEIGSQTNRHRKIFESNSIFYTSGITQEDAGFRYDAFVSAVDQDGNILWHFNYGLPEIYENFGGFKVKANGNIVCYGTRATGAYQGSPLPGFPHPSDSWLQNIEIELNPAGEIVSEIIGNEYNGLDTIAGIGNSFIIDENNNFVYTASDLALEEFGEAAYTRTRPVIVRTDENLNTIWQTSVGEHTSSNNLFYSLVGSNDGGWIGAGRYYIPSINNEKGHHAGHIAKVNINGELQWERTDTLFYGASYEEDEITQYFNSVFTLPSGSIIATGRIDNYEVSPPRSYGWMIKLDPDGCLTPGCHPNLTGINIAEQMQHIEVFPNPTSHYVTVKAKEKFTTEVYDAFGKQVRVEENHYEEGRLDLSNLAAGIYFINVRSGGHFIYTKKVIKQQ